MIVNLATNRVITVATIHHIKRSVVDRVRPRSAIHCIPVVVGIDLVIACTAINRVFAVTPNQGVVAATTGDIIIALSAGIHYPLCLRACLLGIRIVRKGPGIFLLII